MLSVEGTACRYEPNPAALQVTSFMVIPDGTEHRNKVIPVIPERLLRMRHRGNTAANGG
ncbi:MAG: hypothetical protein IPI71_03355 [Methanolinea sp.]|nr:MAG: hypothetical protein IPI71_03355 [Methanolinea sp.]